MATPITTHVADALARLLEQLRGRPRVEGLVGALAGGVQVLEDQLAALPVGLSLAGAVGAQLDVLGAVVGIARNGVGDDAYRLLIRGQIGRNTSDSTTETILGLARTLFAASDVTVNAAFTPGHAHRMAPCTLALEIGNPGTSSTLWPICLRIIQQALAAGVALTWVDVHADADAFALAGSTPGKGLGDIRASGSGGALASLVQSTQAA